ARSMRSVPPGENASRCVALTRVSSTRVAGFELCRPQPVCTGTGAGLDDVVPVTVIGNWTFVPLGQATAVSVCAPAGTPLGTVRFTDAEPFETATYPRLTPPIEIATAEFAGEPRLVRSSLLRPRPIEPPIAVVVGRPVTITDCRAKSGDTGDLAVR